MKRRIAVLSVLLLSVFALLAPNSVNSEHPGTCGAVGCIECCYMRADLCYQACDQNPPGGRAVCYNNCMWEQEICSWSC